MHFVQEKIEPLQKFSQDSYRLVRRCTKPNIKEFKQIALATAIGFSVMGFIGFFVKLVYIPINNIIL
ncbi:Protein transport protein Sec61 subunit gamma [Intoshia linei]|uniref:Protein transport protein Sec61 subunit gamma n=1 Tax=Intoshia linei TaxID=1819745 RepID=A0A177AWR9_9BILA|nr:Protein transport protein Sec61 subunit gamma [Intoshia linei]